MNYPQFLFPFFRKILVFAMITFILLIKPFAAVNEGGKGYDDSLTSICVFSIPKS